MWSVKIDTIDEKIDVVGLNGTVAKDFTDTAIEYLVVSA